MKTSTKHFLLQCLVGSIGITVFLGPIWGIPYLERLPTWLGLLGLVAAGFVILSVFGVGPWGRAFNRALTVEDIEYRKNI